MNVVAGTRQLNFERGFYLTVSFVFFALVFWVFAHTYYLKLLFGTPVLPMLLHVHGFVMSGWVVLLTVQSGLVAAHRVQWHRRLGVFGTAWAALVVIMGSTTTLHAAAREVRAHSPGAAMQLTITGLELTQMLFFAGFVGLAVWLRRRTDYHKRLMVLTVACMLPSVLARLPVAFMTNRLILLALDVFVVLCVVVDTLRHRRLHPAFAWGGALFVTTFHVALYAMQTPTWVAFGTWVMS